MNIEADIPPQETSKEIFPIILSLSSKSLENSRKLEKYGITQEIQKEISIEALTKNWLME